ncbi:MAG: hypothetical protein C0626_04245 [Arcobacter sp.]|nr:MAG: hypothetical protein C0626_04245 [Arcobacter sp.]
MINTLNLIFNTSSECKDNTCKLSKKDIKQIYKPDLGIKDLKMKKSIFGSIEPTLCDCLIIHKNDKITLLEIKCGTVTNHILKEIIEQISNVYRILENQGINIHKCIFICKKFSDSMVKKRLLNKRIKHITLSHKIYNTTAIEI